MKTKILFFGILFFGLSFWSTETKAQKVNAVKNYNHSCRITYLDGNGAMLSGFLDYFEIIETQTKNKYQGSWVTGIKNDTIKIHCNWAGKYSLLFMDTLLLNFEVTEKEGKLISNLQDEIVLPFNYLVTAPPHQQVFIYSMQGAKVAQHITDKSGFLFLKENSAFFSDKFLICNFQHQFPQIKTFQFRGAKYDNQLRNRKINFKPSSMSIQAGMHSRGTSQYNNAVVHNLKENTFYRIATQSFKPNGNKYVWLLGYNTNENKSFFRKMNLSGNLKALATDIFLNDKGRPVIVIAQQDPKTYDYSNTFYLLTQNNTLQKTEYPTYPVYQFKNYYVQGSNWIIPTDFGIALTPGTHTYQTTCTGSWTPPNPALSNWNKRLREIDKKIYHSGKLAEGEYARLLKEKSALQKAGPPKGKPDVLGKRTITSTIKVVFSPEEKFLYRIIRQDENANPGKNNDQSAENYQDFSDMEIEKCVLSIDGSGPLDYSYKDPDRLKSISYADWDNEEERQKAIAAVDVLVGTEPDVVTSGESFRLFQRNVKAGWPINLWEGPYPELRYKIKQMTGEYSTKEEALKRCNNVERHYGKYACYKEKIVRVCLDNYRFSVKDGKVITDTAALYCGKGTEEVYMPQGQNILVVVSAKGFRAKTMALNKKDLQVSDIHLSGTITDQNGHPVKGVKISLIGQNVSFVTDSTGRYTLNGKAHGKEPLTETVNIKLEPIGVEISNDTLGTYDPEKPFGLVADGFTTLKLHIKTNGINPSTVVVHPPSRGGFVPQGSLKIPLVLDENGEGDLEYVPPEYLRYRDLNKHLQIKPENKGVHGMSGNLWAAEVPVTISYEDTDGIPGTFSFNILVFRPPVMLIHGFTGNETTWEHLGVHLRRDKYDAIIREYYQGTIEQSSIQTQAVKLSFYIQELRKAYFKSGIIQNRVDIVAHSMGGLISRYYISNMPKYGKKAGIAIPYNVRLSKNELEQMRFQKPVILNDVRKLIMVGTPNHGASFMDERIGAMNALIRDVHQIANEQLRYDSPFLAKLNAGESEGRHLDPNVQYALIYGLRRRSQVYPLDNIIYPVQTAVRDLAPDDGVVTKNSAMLNGVVSYRFPPDPLVYKYGYIHSPALADYCIGDASITIDTAVFNKIEELLQEDIPRIPLKNSVSKIISATGDVSLRYYSTQNWVRLHTPIHYPNLKKLHYNFCRIKTGEGAAVLGFFLNGHHWGSLSIQPHTIVYYQSASPEYVRIYLQQGKARFRSRKKAGGGFDVVMGDRTGEKWYAFNPKARVKDLNTDFIVEKDSLLDVHSISGKVVLALPPAGKTKPQSKTITTRGGYTLSPTGTLTESPLPDSGWWSNTDTAFLADEVIDSLKIMLENGGVQLRFSNACLPVSGFSTLAIHADTLPSDSLGRAFHVQISLKNNSLLPFVSLTNPEGMTDSLGNYQTGINMKEPSGKELPSLAKMPLQAVLHIRLFLPTGQIEYETDTTLPLGMTMLYGQVLGPGFQPRRQPEPPALSSPVFQIASDTDTSGRFYILFNTTLYNKLKKKSATYDTLRFSLMWPDEVSAFPLKYDLPDNLKGNFPIGKKVQVGKNGHFDLPNINEQEQRIKKLTELFVEMMKLTPEKRNALIRDLNALPFEYGADVPVPVLRNQPGKPKAILIPLQPKEFWNKAIYDTNNISFTGIMRAMSDFISQSVCAFDAEKYDFLQDTGVRQKAGSFPFEKAAFTAFQKTGKEFFIFLMRRFLEETGNPFVTQSLWSDHFFADTVDHSNASAWENPATQLKFLKNYYGGSCRSEPAAVYGDFLLNRLLYARISNSGDPSMTLAQWLITKKSYYKDIYLVSGNDPFPEAGKFGLSSENLKIELIPVFADSVSAVEMGGQTYHDFRHIPQIPLKANSDVTILGGKFRILVPGVDTGSLILLGPGAKFKTGEKGRPAMLLSGTFHFSVSIPLATPFASLRPQSTDFVVTLDAKRTTISVYSGAIDIKSTSDEARLSEGFTSSVGKNGKIKKPKEMKNFTKPSPPEESKLPFITK